MYYIGSKILYPRGQRDPERFIPQPESLRGLLYDYSDHTVVTYDATEHKFLWIERDIGALIQSALVNSPIDGVIGMTQFGNVVYMLHNEGNGALAIYTGSLQEGRTTGVINVTKFGIPPYNQFPRYNPDYCDIFNIGSTLYLLLNMTGSTTTQIIVEFDLLGFFRNPVNLASITTTAVAATWHDNVIALLAKTNIGSNNNVVYHVRMTSTGLVSERHDFIYGPLPLGANIVAGGRFFYSLIANRIFKSEIMMIKVALEEGWPNTQSVDLGSVASGQVIFRKIRIQNINPTQTYKGLMVYSTDPNLSVSLESSTNKFDYSNTIVLAGDFTPNATAEFWICLIAPSSVDDKVNPVQYFDYLYFKALEVV